MKTTTGAAIFIGLMVVFVSAAADAQENFGAIAFSKSTGQTGWAYDYASKSEAEDAALDSCGENDCEIQVWFQNSCGALAQADDGSLGYSWAYRNRSDAQDAALSKCDEVGSGCRVLAWACTTR